jgi:multiple sugar transport system permease protein
VTLTQPARALAVNGALAVISVLTLMPLLWMVSASFMAPGEAARFPPPLLPQTPTLANYHELFATVGIGRQFANSVVMALGATALSLAFNVAAGYAFAKLRFAGRERLFLMLERMGLVNTLPGVLIPWLASVFGIFLVRQYALSIPDELLEAARVDGASEWRIFFDIVLPLLKPVLITLALLSFLGAWNDFMWPLIVLSDRDLQTLPVALAALSREHVSDTELMMAGAVVTVLPVLVLFLALQRHYMQGLLMGSVKG